MQFVYSDGGRKDAGFRGNAGDCVCRAIAIASGIPYKDIYYKLAHGNCTQRNGKYSKRGPRTASEGIRVQRVWFKRFMQKLGFEWVPTMKVGQGCKVHMRDGELPNGRLVVNLSKHCAAVIDGVLFDTHDCSRDGMRCVYGYWRWTGERSYAT